jgi:hypothetical protein
MELGSEDGDLVYPDASSTPKTEAGAYSAPLIQKIGAPSIAQIEKLIGELQEAKKSSRNRGRANSARDGSLYKIRSVGFGLGKNHL